MEAIGRKIPPSPRRARHCRSLRPLREICVLVILSSIKTRPTSCWFTQQLLPVRLQIQTIGHTRADTWSKGPRRHRRRARAVDNHAFGRQPGQLPAPLQLAGHRATSATIADTRRTIAYRPTSQLTTAWVCNPLPGRLRPGPFGAGGSCRAVTEGPDLARWPRIHPRLPRSAAAKRRSASRARRVRAARGSGSAPGVASWRPGSLDPGPCR